MKDYSYTRLLILTTAALVCLAALLIWHWDINQPTFLAPQTLKMMLVVIPTLGLCLCFGFKKWCKTKRKLRIVDYIALWAGLSIVAAPIIYFLAITVVWLLPGTLSSYTAASEFSTGGRKSCAAAYFYDRELDRNIKLCGRWGSYSARGTLHVTKRSHDLGMVIVNSAAQY